MSTEDHRHVLLDRYVHAVLDSRALVVRREPIKLRSGGSSHIYLNHNALLSQPEHLLVLSDVYAYLLGDIRGSSLGVVDSVMSPILVGILVTRLNLPLIVIKEKQLSHGVEQQLFGEPKGDVVLIDDMTSTGGLLVKSAQVLRNRGAFVNRACLCVTRSEEPVRALNANGIEPCSLTTFNEVIRFAWPHFSDEQKELIRVEIAQID